MCKEIVAVLLMLLLQACTLPLAPLPTITSTITAAPSDTPTPSRTPAPSRTPLPPTVTPSLTGTPPTSTGTSGAALEVPPGTPALEIPINTPVLELNCKLVFKSPRDGVHYDPKEHFNAGWMVTNTGTASWDPGIVDFTYVNGTRMHKFASVVLDGAVSPGATISLTAEMIAPRETGNHQTLWSLRRGHDYFCPLSLRITVP